MITAPVSLAAFLQRAASEPALLAELRADALGAAYRAGVRLTLDDLKAALDLAGVTDLELIEVLLRRLASRSTGCGDCETPIG